MVTVIAAIADFNRYAASNAPVGRYTSRIEVLACSAASCEIGMFLRTAGVNSMIAGRTLVFFSADGAPLPAAALPMRCRDTGSD